MYEFLSVSCGGGNKKLTYKSVTVNVPQKSGYSGNNYTYTSDKDLVAVSVSRLQHGRNGRISIKSMDVTITNKRTVNINTTSQVDNASSGSNLTFTLLLYYYT